MRGKELIECVLAGEKPPRAPVYGVITSDALMEHFGGEKLTPENSERVAVRAYRNMVDFTRPFADTLGPNWNTGSRPDALGYVWRHERWTKWVEKLPYDSTTGMKKLLEAEIEKFRAWQPPAENTPQQQVPDTGPPLSAASEIDRFQEELGDEVLMTGRAPIGCSHGPYFRDGLDWWTYLHADYPEVIEAWAKARHEMNLRRIASLVRPQVCPVEFVDSDLGYKTGLFFSPKFLHECGWFKRLAELVDCFHNHGVKVIYHSDGDIRPILKDLEGTGIDGLNPIETAAGLTVGEVRRQCPDLIIVGGIDNHILSNGTAAEAREVTLRCLKEGGHRLIIGTSTEEFDDAMQVENVVAALETIWDYSP